MIASEISTKLARPGVVRGVLHESSDQAAIFAPLAKAVYRPRTPESAVAAVAEAAEVAMTWPRGPVYVDIPTDVLDMQIESIPEVRGPVRIAPDAAQISAAAAAIDAAARVVIWSGGGVIEADARDELLALAEKIAAPIVTTFAGQGIVPPEHPCAVGVPPHEPEIEALVADADLLLAVGTKFDANSTRNWTMPRPAKLVSVNCDPVDLSKNYEPDVGVLADAKLALAQLTAAVSDRAPIDGQIKTMAAATLRRLHVDRAGASAMRVVDAVMTARLATDATVIVDMAIPGYWVGGYGSFELPRRLQYPVGWGTLGYALPASVGAGAVRDRPVLTVCGDGGFMFAPGELAVLVQERLPVTVLLVDDGGYGMLKFDQDAKGDAHRGVDLFRPDFVALAASFGIEATLVEGVDDSLPTLLTEALKSGEPRMVVLRERLMPPRTTSPRWHEK